MLKQVRCLSLCASRHTRADDVVVEIRYCGICPEDVHYVRDDGNNTNFTMVSDHEIIGRVVSAGPGAIRFRQGDHVGVGYMVDSCQHCEACKQGLEQYCQEGPALTYNSMDRHNNMPTFGGYSEKIVAPEKFVLRIRNGLALKGTAPLLCSGISTWSPLPHWQVEKEQTWVLSLGGLGHMALKLAKGLGGDVTLFTCLRAKDLDARCLGADNVVTSTDADRWPPPS